MANLIITVISIALVAVAALMGAYYGGEAFTVGQAKARANTIISQGEQLANAWQSYTVDHNNNNQIAAFSDLVPAYISAVPTPPSSDVTTSEAGLWSGWSLVTLADDSTAAYPFVWANTHNAVITVIADDNICDKITQMAHDNSATPTDPGAGSAKFSAGSAIVLTGKFDCYRYTATTVPENIFVYRAF